MSIYVKQNETIEQLSGIVAGEGQQLLVDLFYPVGTYYETSIESFDPNISWGGTWIQDTKGLTTSGAYESTDIEEGNSKLFLSIGQTTGEVNHTLTVSELAKHKHPHKLIATSLNDVSGNVNEAGYQTNIMNNYNMVIYSEGYGFETGRSEAHNNTQPTIGVIRWHRIA